MYKDLTGQHFGNLVVTDYNDIESHKASVKAGKQIRVWNCICTVCGEKVIKRAGNLTQITKNGTTGCKVCNGQTNIIGEIFGSLKVISVNEEETKNKTIKYGKVRTAYNCECINCGYKTIKLRSDLTALKRTGTNGCKECNRKELSGQKFGRLTVIGLAPEQVYGKQLWLCKCECGKEVIYETGQLTKTKNPVQSCGCLHSDTLAQRNRATAKWNGDTAKHERLHRIWFAMKHRCNSPNDMHYHLYGGRGITVCEEWQNNWFAFRDWALSNGYQDNLTIDRINVDKNYEPDNCRWVTQQEQMNNTRINKYLEYKGEFDTLANWCRRLNLDYFRTKARLNTCEYTVEEAFELGKYELRTT